jgi:hypothetical protein
MVPADGVRRLQGTKGVGLAFPHQIAFSWAKPCAPQQKTGEKTAERSLRKPSCKERLPTMNGAAPQKGAALKPACVRALAERDVVAGDTIDGSAPF